MLLSSRNPDGGWPSRRGRRSWTEPTALALIALQSGHVSSETRSLTASWLADRQSYDGGWPPCATVPKSTWVSSLALLALGQESTHSRGCPNGAVWLTNLIYPEQSAIQAFLQRTLGLSPSQAPGSVPWFPGTAGWVIPTAFSILALSSWSRRVQNVNLAHAVNRAQAYLLSRRCSDGGWNHGGSPMRSEAATSYAETTGLALLALSNNSSPTLGPTLRMADGLLQQANSNEGVCWLLMGLAAHGIRKEEAEFRIRTKTVQDVALRLITLKALDGHNPFLQPAL